MSLPTKKRLYFIADSKNRTVSMINGIPTPTGDPTPLKQNPAGWRDISIGFATNAKLFSLNRAFTVPLSLVNDGADIIRYYMYRGKGYEEELYLLILTVNNDTGIMELEYRGKIDMSRNEDNPEFGVTITTVEGGILAYLNANESVTNEVACDETNPAAIKILFDGITLRDKFVYSVLNIASAEGIRVVVPIAYLKNEGDSTGVIYGSPTMEFFPEDYLAWARDSNNYLFKSIYSISSFTVSGKLSLRYTQDVGGGSQYIKLISSKGKDINLVTIPDQQAQDQFTGEFNVTINLEPDEKVFIVSVIDYNFSPRLFDFLNTEIYLDFETKAEPSTAWAMRPLDLFKGLVAKMTDGKYTAGSNLFTAENTIVCTTGDAIRNTSRDVVKNYLIKTSFSDFFQSYNGPYGIGTKVIDDVLYIERKRDIYQDNGDDIFDLGEISGVKIRYATDMIVNTVKTGAPNQDYQERSGKFESNTVTEWKLPVTSVNKTLDLTSKYRQDPFGIEFIRANLTQKDSTDNEGDDQVFMVNISNINGFSAPVLMNQANKTYTITGGAAYRKWFFVGDIFQITSGTVINNGGKEITSISQSGNDLVIGIREFVFQENVAMAGFAFRHYLVKRENYASITGVLDNTVFNIEGLSPARQLRAHGDYLRGLLSQSLGDVVTYQSKQKNTNLVTVYNSGERIAETEDVPVNTLTIPFFLPYYISFTTEVPMHFAKILKQLNKGHIKATYKGHTIYMLPIGDMDAKPATNEAQEWKLILSPKTSPATLALLSGSYVALNDDMKNSISFSDLNPLHFVKYNYQTPPQYHHKDIYDERYESRNQRFAVQPQYLQKFQNNDPIALQFITTGYGALSIIVTDAQGETVDTLPVTTIADPSIQLPYTKQEIRIDITSYDPGVYSFIVAYGPTLLGISEWVHIDEDFPDTYRIDYFNTYNTLDAFFSTWRPCIRLEALFMPATPDGSGAFYQDESGSAETLSGTPFMRRVLHLGNGYGIPDWMIKKLNKITFLNRTWYENQRYTRDEESKIEVVERVGYPMNMYRITLRESVAANGLTIIDTPLPGEVNIAAYTLEAEAFGFASGVINIEVEQE